MKLKFIKWIKVLLGLIILTPHVLFAAQSKLTNVNMSNGEYTSRLEFNLTHSVKFRITTLSHPERIAIDFPQTKLGTTLPTIALKHSVIKSIRDVHLNPVTLRLVLDLNYPVNVKTLSQKNKLIVDIYAKKPVEVKTPLAKATTSKSMVASSKMLLPKSLPPKPIIVVIDPGHGGKDPGAVGELGAKEKNIVLGIAKHLVQLANREKNIRIVLTREGDYFVPLAGRLKLARKGKADLFISIHADSYFNDQSSGASVYALSQRGATSVAARWLSSRENHSELGGVDLTGLGDQSLQLRSVLIDLAQTATNMDSLRLGNSMLDALDDISHLHYARVEQAPFLVLKSPDIPSILVEVGFLSNRKEEEKLQDSNYQAKVAEALYQGINLYIKKYLLARDRYV